jgi:xanthine dehydrogenase accessory factor
MPAETRKLLTMWSSARQSGEACALATVVRVAGSSYRKPGARMLITRSGPRMGTVSGGCLEGEVVRKIWWLTEDGPAVQDYATSYDDDSVQSYGLGCDGVVTLLLERTSRAADVFEALRMSVQERIPSAIVTVIGTNTSNLPLGAHFVLPDNAASGLATRATSDLHEPLLPIAIETLRNRQSWAVSVELPAGSVDLFAEYVAPPPALSVFGAGDDAKPVVHLAQSMGWEISVFDGRSHLATPARFPLAHHVSVISPDALNHLAIQAGDTAVVLTHSYVQDVAILRALLPLNLGYLGILGPRRRTERIVEEVAPSIGMTADQALESLKSPVGLDLGAGSPDVIALSIVAEIQAVLSKRSAAPLNLSAVSLASPLASSIHD